LNAGELPTLYGSSRSISESTKATLSDEQFGVFSGHTIAVAGRHHVKEHGATAQAVRSVFER